MWHIMYPQNTLQDKYNLLFIPFWKIYKFKYTIKNIIIINVIIATVKFLLLFV